MKISNEGSDGAVHIAVICKAELKEFKPVLNHGAIGDPRAFFLQNSTVNIVNIEIETWIIAVPLKRTEVEGAKTQLRCTLL